MASKKTEHVEVRLPLVEELIKFGWDKHQIQIEPEWRVPKNPSEASKREVGNRFDGYPVDVAIFDHAGNVGNYEHLLIIVETKSPDKTAGINQLKIYMGLEPHVRLGIWTNGSERAYVFRTADGSFVVQRKAQLPKPSESLILAAPKKLTWGDLVACPTNQLRKIFSRLLDIVVARDTKSTRRDDQLNHLCNLLLVKLESDKVSKLSPGDAVVFQVWDSESETAKKIQTLFRSMRLTHSDLFSTDVDKVISLDDHTIHLAAYELSNLRLLDVPINVISEAFQVFRTATLKSEEGQYYTPYPVIRSAVRFMEVHPSDRIIDPACGTGGFLLESYRQLRESFSTMADADAKGWAQRHIFGIDKDRINVKLTKAIMLIIGDGSTHIYLADSLRSHLWSKHYPDLLNAAADESFSCIITNPPFGKNLKLSKNDARLSDYAICRKPKNRKERDTEFEAGVYEERELGLVFLERCYRLLIPGGRLGIILPETYMFSPTYAWLQSWLRDRLMLRGILNVPMEAFQGFCRAKTNFYVFEKVAPTSDEV